METLIANINNNSCNTSQYGTIKGDEYCYDTDGGRVVLTEDASPDGTEIYKKVTHNPQNGVKIKYIKHKNSIIPDSEGEYDKISVYYWQKDASCERPLLIYALKNGRSHIYFANNGNDIWSIMKGEGKKDTEQLRGSILDKKLDEINCKTNNFTYIDISMTYNYPYSNNLSSKIIVEDDTLMVEDNFIAYEHFDTTKSTFSVNRFWNGDSSVRFASKSLTLYNISKVVVWYWTKDIRRRNPLVISIKSGSDTFFYCHSANDLWSMIKFRVLHLSRVLNLENCRRNNAHALDISDYVTIVQCPFCGKDFNKTLVSDSSRNYSGYCYSPISYDKDKTISIAFFIVGDSRQMRLPVIYDLHKINVYLYPKVKGIPLLINTQSPSEDEWYKKTELKDTWDKIYENSADKTTKNGDVIEKMLPHLLTTLAINLDITTGTYSHLGETIYVERHQLERYYLKYVHKLKGDYAFNIENITHRRMTLDGIPTSDPLVRVSVIYWTENFDFDVPLLVMLDGCDGKSTHYVNNDKTWEPCIHAENDIFSILDGYNCRLNGIHAVDISRTDSYECMNLTCHALLRIETDSSREHMNYGYTKKTTTRNTQSLFSIHTFISNGSKQSGISLKEKIYEMNTYFYPAKSETPALIYFTSPVNCWYRRDKVPNTWKFVEIEDRPVNDDDTVTIRRNILLPISPTITIEIEQTTHKDGLGSYYDYEAELEIQLAEREDIKGYHRYIHRVKDKTFFLKHARYRESILKDITSDDPIDSISVFYASTDTENKTPLLVELSNFHGTCVYYEEDIEAKMWIKVPIGGRNIRLDGIHLNTALDKAYSKHFPSHTGKIFLGICGAAGTLGILWSLIRRMRSEKKLYQKLNNVTFKLVSKRP